MGSGNTSWPRSGRSIDSVLRCFAFAHSEALAASNKVSSVVTSKTNVISLTMVWHGSTIPLSYGAMPGCRSSLKFVEMQMFLTMPKSPATQRSAVVLRFLHAQRIFGRSRVMGWTWVTGRSQVFEDAIVKENACISEDAMIYGQAVVGGQVRVCGRARSLWHPGCLGRSPSVVTQSFAMGDERESRRAMSYRLNFD